MKTLKNIFAKSLPILFILLLVACNSSDGESEKEEISNDNEQQSHLSEENESDLNLNDHRAEEEEASEKVERAENSTESEHDLKITSGDEAVSHLKEQLEEGKNDDISFGTDDTLRTDDKGSYYTVQLVDVPLRISGKTGNLGYYKVYKDGTYEIIQAELPENIQLTREDYVNKLDELTEEVDQFRKNSEATTTLEIEKDEVYILELWDQELNAIYGILQEQLSQDEMDQLREEQRNWINIRDETAEEAAKKYEGERMESLEYVVTLANVTKERCYELVENYMK